MSKIACLTLLACLVTGSYATNYCNPALCPDGGVHIGCQNSDVFAATCLSPSLVDFSVTLQNKVVDKHNGYRNKVASGGASSFPSAVRMQKLKWNAELAQLAQYNVRQCKMQHDECRNTDDFPYSGQNLGYSATTAQLNPSFIQTAIEQIMEDWYNEINDTTQNWLDKYPLNTNGKVIGHFTVMIQDQATDIGCAAATYKKPSGSVIFNTVLMACNYSYTNIRGQPVYVKGKVASKCMTGRDTTYPALCSAAEKVSSNPFYLYLIIMIIYNYNIY